MSAPPQIRPQLRRATTPSAAESQTTAAVRPLDIVVLGARDSGADALAAYLALAPNCTVREHLPDATEQHDLPDLIAVAVDAVCPIRPDDLQICCHVAQRAPTAVVLIGVSQYSRGETAAAETDHRLESVGLGATVHWSDGATPHATNCTTSRSTDAAGTKADAATFLDALREHAVRLRITTPQPAAASPLASPALPPAEAALLEWLRMRRTEVIASRSSSLRSNSHRIRLELSTNIGRALRPLLAKAKMELLATRSADLAPTVERIQQRAHRAGNQIVLHARVYATELCRRHLAGGIEDRHIIAPEVEFPLSQPPRQRVEEMVMLAMGAAAGTGVGRLVATPLSGRTGALAAVIMISLLADCALGYAGIRTRRSTVLRQHLIGVVTESHASLRSELEQAVTEHLLAAEAAIADSFAHDPGPRVRELDRRIRHLRENRDCGSQSSPQLFKEQR